MPTPTFTTTCLYNKQIANDVWEFRLEKPEGFLFKAGQFVLFETPLIDDPEDTQPRAFSVASAPDDTSLLFVAKMKQGGRASRWISESLKEGSEVTFQGPFGLFVHKDTDTDCLFVGTSSGIAPFRSQILDRHHRNLEGKMDLLFGVRAEEDLFWVEEFQSLEQEIPSFTLHLALTKPSTDWNGQTGRVQQVIPQLGLDLTNRSIFICGNPEMTKEVKDLCLGEWGVEKGRVHMEGYI